MMPTGLADILVFPGNQSPKAAPEPTNRKRKEPSEKPPLASGKVTHIGLEYTADFSLLQVLQKNTAFAKVTLGLDGIACVVCRIADNFSMSADLLKRLPKADPVIEIVGVDGVPVGCQFIGIRVVCGKPDFILLHFKLPAGCAPEQELNVKKGRTWTAPKLVKVHTSNALADLPNCEYDQNACLRL